MKKLLMLSLVAMLSLSLVACTAKEEEQVKEDTTSEVIETENLFKETLEDVQPGTAGCSLKSTIVAVDYLNFYKEAKENDEEIESEKFTNDFKELFDALSDDDKATFIESWNMVYADIISMCGEGNGAEISEKLETAGCLEKGNYPWTEEESIELYDMVNNALSKYVSNALAE